MNPGDWLNQKCRSLCVPEKSPEWEMVRTALDNVEACIGGIAERYPCGSFAKSTMLPGRKEADLVLVMAEAPTSQTLEELQQMLAKGLTLAHPPQQAFKAIQLEFADGAKVDVLPVAKSGVTAEGPSVPRKLRVALSGPAHVRWFIDHAHGTVIHDAVRLLKEFRDVHPAEWGSLHSFAIEVMMVTLLEPSKDQGLVSSFRHVLDELGQGWLEGRKLPDPARPQNDLLVDLDEQDRKRIAAAARDAVKRVDGDLWSQVFSKKETHAPRPGENLGGKTLA